VRDLFPTKPVTLRVIVQQHVQSQHNIFLYITSKEDLISVIIRTYLFPHFFSQRLSACELLKAGLFDKVSQRQHIFDSNLMKL